MEERRYRCGAALGDRAVQVLERDDRVIREAASLVDRAEGERALDARLVERLRDREDLGIDRDARRRLVGVQHGDRAPVASNRVREQGGGGIESGVAYAAALTDLTVQLSELETLGVQLKDFERGLVDFPSLREGRVVLLCWQLGEGDELEWWHDVDAGFAGRTPL